MGMEVYLGPIIAMAVIFFLMKLISLPFWLLKNSIVGAIMIYIFNFFGLFTIKLTFIHCLIAGIFGVPGVIGLVAYTYFLK